MSWLKYPKTIIDFQKMFRTEEECAQYLHQCRWPRGFGCPKCKAGLHLSFCYKLDKRKTEVESEKPYSISQYQHTKDMNIRPLTGWAYPEEINP